MALHRVLEALARIEHKLDLLLRGTFVGPHTQMHFIGQKCPVCLMQIDYQIDAQHGVVFRKCGCQTGKTPLLPMNVPGVSDAGTDRRNRTEARETEPEDRPDRKAR